jgi:hypothetical protein
MLELKEMKTRDLRPGTWVRMGDGQPWMFPHPPAPGTDAEYEALIRCLLEAEDEDETRRIELALSILLLSRNYDPQPCGYQAIFNFGADRATRLAAQAAISELIYSDLEERFIECRPQTIQITYIQAVFGGVQSWFKSCAVRFRTTVATQVHGTIPKPPSSS